MNPRRAWVINLKGRICPASACFRHLYLDGVTICPIDTADAQKMGIGTVYQEVNLLPNISIAANLFIGREPLHWGLIDHRAMNQQATKLLKGYGLELDVQRLLTGFSITIQQIVAIARAVDLSAKVLAWFSSPTFLAKSVGSVTVLLFCAMANSSAQKTLQNFLALNWSR